MQAVQARSLAATTLIESLRISGTPHAACDCGFVHYSGGAIALRARDRECWLLDEQSGGGKRVRVLLYTADRKRPLFFTVSESPHYLDIMCVAPSIRKTFVYSVFGLDLTHAGWSILSQLGLSQPSGVARET